MSVTEHLLGNLIRRAAQSPSNRIAAPAKAEIMRLTLELEDVLEAREANWEKRARSLRVQGADIDLPLDRLNGLSLAEKAICKKDSEVLDFFNLRERGYNYVRKFEAALIKGIQTGNEEILRSLGNILKNDEWKSAWDINVKEAVTPDGVTILHHAATLGDEETLKILLWMGADSDAKDKSGRTPADYAEASGKMLAWQNTEELRGRLKAERMVPLLMALTGRDYKPRTFFEIT